MKQRWDLLRPEKRSHCKSSLTKALRGEKVQRVGDMTFGLYTAVFPLQSTSTSAEESINLTSIYQRQKVNGHRKNKLETRKTCKLK